MWPVTQGGGKARATRLILPLGFRSAPLTSASSVEARGWIRNRNKTKPMARCPSRFYVFSTLLRRKLARGVPSQHFRRGRWRRRRRARRIGRVSADQGYRYCASDGISSKSGSVIGSVDSSAKHSSSRRAMMPMMIPFSTTGSRRIPYMASN